MPQNNLTYIGFTPEELKNYLKWREWQSQWEKLFADNFIGSLTIHRAGVNPQIDFEWRNVEHKEIKKLSTY